MEAALQLLQGELAPVAFAAAVLVLLLVMPRLKGQLRDGRWATARELRRAGYFSRQGVILGLRGRRLLRVPGDSHVLLAAPTRSGKGVGFVIPNLLDWPGSVVVLDVKGENYAATAGWRQEHGQEVYRFSPGEAGGHRWNPLAAISSDPAKRQRDVLRLAAALFPASEGRDDFWAGMARDLFAGVALAVLEARGRQASLGDVYRMLHHPELAEYAKEELAKEEACLGSVGDRLLAWAETDAPMTRAGVLASARERLLVWGDPLLDSATAVSDFDLASLRRLPTSLYVAVSPSDLDRLAQVLRLFFEQLVEVNTREGFGPGTPCQVPLLLMLDEFAAFGRVPGFERGISYVASYGIRFCIVAQSEAQLRLVYGDQGAQTLIDNCGSRLLFAPGSAGEAMAMSRLLGTRLARQRSRTGKAGLFPGRGSVTVTPVEQPLLRPEEMRALGRDGAIAVSTDCRPVRLRKIRWYRDWRFQSRVRPPSDTLPVSSAVAAAVTA